jgi:hypothetical protein
MIGKGNIILDGMEWREEGTELSLIAGNLDTDQVNFFAFTPL